MNFRSKLLVALSLTITALISRASQAEIPNYGECRVLNGKTLASTAPLRGTYLSLYSNQIGQTALPDSLKQILGHRQKEDRVLEFLIHHQINALTLYDLPTILDDPKLIEALSSFILAARACGVREIHAAGAIPMHFEIVRGYQNRFPGKFDGLVTEFEFWNGTSQEVAQQFKTFLDLLQKMNQLKITHLGQPVKISAYLGWNHRHPSLSAHELAKQISQNLDRIYLHCYVKDPKNAFQYCQSRVQDFLEAQNPLEVIPLFSAEGRKYHAGEEVFMGDWLKNHSLDLAERNFLGDWNQVAPPFLNTSLKLSGFHYFEYSFLSLYLN